MGSDLRVDGSFAVGWGGCLDWRLCELALTETVITRDFDDEM